MARFIWDKSVQKWVEPHIFYGNLKKEKKLTIIPDIESYVSPISDNIVSTRRQRRREMLDHGMIDGREAVEALKNSDRYRNTEWAKRHGSERD